MEKQRRGKWLRLLVASLAALSLGLAGCSGDDGDDGAPGAPGAPGTTLVDVGTTSPEALAELTVSAEITSVTIASPPVVKFKVTDNFGRGVLGLDALRAQGDLAFTRFNIAKLVPAATNSGDPDSWVNYIRNSSGMPSTERNGTLVDHGDGTYTYTFKTNVTNVTTPVVVTYQPTLTHRVAIQISGAGLNPLNPTFDFVPAGGAVTTRRDIAMTASCNECHGVFGHDFHGDNRVEVKFCVTCHNPDLVEGPDNLALPVLAHKIHSANSTYLDSEFAEVTFPTPEFNCLKCHNGADAATPQGNNWQNRPYMAACGGCHNINFSSTPSTDPLIVDHTGGPQANNSGCAGCHPPDLIEGYHISDNATPNNPKVPAGAVNFTYEISGVTVNASNQAVVTFRILADGTPVIFGAPGTTLLTGFTGSPSFLVAYALPQEGIAAPADYNNLGRAAAQPASVSITNIWNGTQGTLAGPDQSGFYTATLTAAAATYPAGATLRAVALQGYFTQTAGTNGIAANTARHTISAVKGVAGEERREVVDSAKCGNCHEWFEGHGGNRVYNMNVCVFCHVPNLSSSGRGANPANINATNQALLIANGYDPANPLGFPENSNNFKDMIHGIHASGVRNVDYDFVRDRGTSGVFYYNWAEVTFPGLIGDCNTCHKPGTWELPLSDSALNTTVRTTGAADGLDADTAAVAAARASVPNATDWVNTPTASSCYYCHDSTLAVAHMRQNGGIISVAAPTPGEFTQRQNVNTVESCAVCHGPGKQADLDVVHGL